MSGARAIARIHEDKAKRVVHVFSSNGYELTAPAGFRDRALKVGRILDDEEFDALRAAARAYERDKGARRAARRERNAATRPVAGTVTGLTHDARHGRFFVEIDGRYALSVTVSQFAEAGLSVGKELDAAAVAALTEGYGVARVAGIIDRLTGYRPRTVAEVRRRLAEKGIAGPLVEAAIAARTGEAYGVLPDVEFARWYAEHRGVPRGRGFMLLVPELRKLGVADEAIELARAEYGADEARDVALAKAARGLDLADERDRRRFVGRVVRHGFRYGDARDYLDAQAAHDEALEEAAAEEA